MKIAVIVSDASGYVNAGLDTERVVRLFDMPAEIEQYIKAKVNPYRTITFALIDESAPPETK